MSANMIAFYFVTIAVVITAALFSYYKVVQVTKSLKKREQDMQRRMYELAILKELGERIGYSLDVKQIVDIITGSLHQFIEYSAASYMLFEPEKILFKIHLEQSVSREFVDEVKKRMLNSLSALTDKNLKTSKIEEIISGAILVDELDQPVKSYFNIPLVIGEKVVGVITVAHTKEGLYQEEEMTILYKITKQASQAVTKLQEVIATEQRKLSAMVSSMADGVVMTDKEYRLVVVNPAALRAVNLEKKEDVSIFDFIDNLEGKFDIRGKLEESVKLDKIFIADEVLLGDHYYQIVVSPVKTNISGQEEILGGVVIWHDITHDKEVEKMREDFTAMMVHELRSPLDGIKKMSEVLQEIDIKKDKDTHDDFIRLINKNASGMLALVNDLLDVAKIEAGKFEVQLQEKDIKALIEDRVSSYKAQAKAAKIKLSANLASDLPAKLRFDEGRITQVLNNLLSNAIKFTDSGGWVELQAFVHHKGQDIVEEAKAFDINWWVDEKKIFINEPDSVIIAVTDSGIGIPKDKIPELFNKFKQLKVGAAKQGKEGTGLGLVIAKGLVEAHGGNIAVYSQEGKGSTFVFNIPLKQS